jgi:hypothetical protein
MTSGLGIRMKNAGIVDGCINYPGLEAAVLCQTSFLSCATINNGHMAPMGQNYRYDMI